MFSLATGVDEVTMGVNMISPLLVAVLFAVATANPFTELRSEVEFRDTNLDEPAYRLRDTIQPSYYYVDLDVYLDESRFNGLVQIEITVQEDNVTQIALHQNVVSIVAVTVLDSSNNPVALQFPGAFQTDSYYELLLINLANPINAGDYSLTISYTGQINENPFDRGLYKGYYYLNGVRREYATTQFQPYHARKAFPCFDEPQFKSRFVISITRSTDLGPSYSNMAINETFQVSTNRIRETFLPTPTISAYLIAFHISDFVASNTTGTAAKPFGIVSRPGVFNQHTYAAEVGIAITDWLSDYLSNEYYEHGQDQLMKNDHIALPDFPSGAMENWGMVNYREAYLLYDEANTNLINKIFIGTIISHEMAHKWFGNLVTCFWWSNLWLNESFASYFEYFATAGVEPELELDDQFVVDAVHAGLTNDAAVGATPMNWSAVATNPSITSHFSATSYTKGASVLRMMEHLVTPDTFRKALSYYLRDNQYELGTPELMYEAFTTAVAEDQTMTQYSVNIATIFDSWIQNAGAPVVNVDINYSTGAMTLTQERFLVSKTATIPDTIWQIPITYSRAGAIDFENTTPVTIMTGQSLVINKPAGEEWVIFNNAHSGYYRVNYDDYSWSLIAAALRENRETIHKLNRAQIVFDVLFFIRSDKISIERAFDVLSFLEDETDYYPWAGALTQLDWIRRRLEHIPTVYQEYTDFISESLESAVQTLGYEELSTDSTSTILNRMQIMNYACNLGHEACVADSLTKWEAFRANPTNSPVPVNARRYVYCAGLRNGDAADYNFLWAQYNSSQNTADMVVMLRTLACTRDQTLIADYLQQTLWSDSIRSHDKTNAFSFALQGNPENLQTVLDFVYNYYPQIRVQYGGSARLNVALSALATYLTDFQDILAFQSWLYTNQVNLPDEFTTGRAVVSTALSNIQWGNEAAVDIFTSLRSRSGASNILAPLSLILAALMMHLMR